ncbi:hypothetical protein D6817_03180 [Candidatus Pacearchaeota archaeon]|nr:MAG: hypothetical protein D6817_03180 [Candidatus Pacearchaeota archaeon]
MNLRYAAAAMIIFAVFSLGMVVYVTWYTVSNAANYESTQQAIAAVTDANPYLVLVFNLITTFLAVAAYLGFARVGEMLRSKAVRLSSLSLVSLTILGFLLWFLFSGTFIKSLSIASSLAFYILTALVGLAFLASVLVLGIGLVANSSRARIAEVVGLLYIVGSALTPIIFGFLIIFVGNLVAAKMFLDLANKSGK